MSAPSIKRMLPLLIGGIAALFYWRQTYLADLGTCPYKLQDGCGFEFAIMNLPAEFVSAPFKSLLYSILQDPYEPHNLDDMQHFFWLDPIPVLIADIILGMFIFGLIAWLITYYAKRKLPQQHG